MENNRHTLKDKNPETMTATCNVCGPDTPLIYYKQRDQYACRRRKNEIKKKSAAKYYEPSKARWDGLTRKYGITEEKFNEMFKAQGECCAICKRKDTNAKGWQIDHDRECCPTHYQTCHECVRGILCSNCNTAIGLMKDNPETIKNALIYLNSKK